MSDYKAYLREQRRLVILRLLSEQAGYRSNSSILYSGLQHLAVPASRDDVMTDIAWLAEQDLVRSEEAVAGVWVATLTARGLDVAQGTASCPGVAKPSPK